MMAGIGAGFGAFADGMASGYAMGGQLKKDAAASKLEQEMAEAQREKDQQIADAQRDQRLKEEEERQRQVAAMRESMTGQPPAQHSAGGMDPSMAMGAMQAFGGSGGAAGGTAGAGGSVGGAAGGSSAAGSGIAAAGPWAALAAIIAVNEKSARNGGHRRDGADYAKDLASGKVLSQDVNERWVPKLGGYENDKTGLLHDAGAGAEFLSLDFKDGFKKLADGGTAKTVLSGIKKLF